MSYEGTLQAKRFKIGLPTQVLIGALLGVFCGLFFGDYCSMLRPLGVIYTMLLQAVVYPYIICTLIGGLGRLTPAMARKLFKHGSVIYLGLLVVTFALLYVLSGAIPVTFSGLAASTASASTPSLLDLLIPSNIFAALANNYVPAVVIFCTLFGIMLHRVKNTAPLLLLLDRISETCLEFWRWLVKFAPYAVFTLLADASGTIKLNQLTDLSEFLLLFFVGTLLLSFWLIPCLISALVPIRYKTLLSELRSAIIISLATTLSVVALPYISEIAHKLIRREKAEVTHSEETNSDEVINTILLISYPFGQLGNFFLWLFILFAAIYFNTPIASKDQLMLPLATYFSSIGSPSTAVEAVSFLSKWLHLPAAETANLYISISPVMRYGQVLASVMGIAFLVIVGVFSHYNRLKINLKKIIFHLVLAALVVIGIIAVTKDLLPNQGMKIYDRISSYSVKDKTFPEVQISMLPAFDETQVTPAQDPIDSLYRIQRTGILRVGYNADMKPFVFFNSRHELAGYDVANMYQLAHDLNAKLEFIPFTWQHLVSDMEADKFDIAIGAIYVTEDRLEKITFTSPYFRSSISLIAPEGQQDIYSSAQNIRKLSNIKIGTFDDPVLIPLIKNNFPNAQLVILPNISGDSAAKALANGEINIALWSEAQTQIWALGHPGYVSIVPRDVASPLLMGYMVQSHSPQFLAFLNYWLELRKSDGFQQKLYDHWILGRRVQDNEPRWSIMHNLLGW